MTPREKGTVTKDDVAQLVRGKPSKNRVGSRAVSHRLRQHELAKLDIAKKRGYLLVNAATRSALINSWSLWCEATNTPCRIESATGTATGAAADDKPRSK